LDQRARRLASYLTLGCILGVTACDADNGGGGSSGGSGGATPTDGGGGSGGTSSGGAQTAGGSGGATDESGGDAGAPADSGGTSATGGSGGTVGDALDVFGVRELYPSAPGGAQWNSLHWDDGDAYSMEERDEHDPSGLSGLRGEGTIDITGTGELVMAGSEPRIYVYPEGGATWQDIEVTVYYQRVEDTGTAYAGLVVGVRSGPDGHNTDTACDAHTYYARLRHDGEIDFEKELKHPASSTQSRIPAEEVWPPDGILPTGQWIGWKFVIYNLGSDNVQLESYRDLTLGEDGGDWEQMNETVDEGGWFVETDCAEHDPVGGESDLVITGGGAVLVRNTEITEARYRWLTIREILPP